MSEPTSPDDSAVGAPERLHPLFLLSGLGGSVRSLGGAYALIAYLIVSGRLGTALLGAVGLLAVMMVGVILCWTRFEYRVGNSDIRIDSGILSRRHRSIPFDRIQDVDITQGPVARLLGLAKVKFETGAASAGTNAEEGVLHAIALERAQEIRALIRSHRSGMASIAATPAEAEADEPIYAINLPRLLLAGLFNFSLALFAGLFGLTQTAGDVVGFDPLDRGFWTGIAQGSEPLTRFILEHRAGAAIAGIVVLMVIGAATGIIRTVLRDWGFRLDRTDIGLRRRRGLLTRTDVTLPVKRAQAAIVGSGPVRSWFGWCELHVQSLAQDEGGKGDHVLAPLARHGEVGSILAELGWRPLSARIIWSRVSLAYIWTFILGLAPVLLLVIAQVAAVAVYLSSAQAGGQALLPTFAAPIILLAVLAIVSGALLLSRWLSWLRTGYALDGNRLLMRSGWWRRQVVILPTARIQSIDLTESFLSRWLGIATLRFGVAGGGIRGHSIPAIPSREARQLRDELLA